MALEKPERAAGLRDFRWEVRGQLVLPRGTRSAEALKSAPNFGVSPESNVLTLGALSAEGSRIHDVTKLPGDWLIPSQGERPRGAAWEGGGRRERATRSAAYRVIVYFKLISWCALLSAGLRERLCPCRIPFWVCLKGKPGLSAVLCQL